MNYEQKYNQVLERAKEELKVCGSQDCDAARQIFRFFPELKKDVDELTWLKSYIKEEVKCLSMDIRDTEDSRKLEKLQKSLAWLEKEGEKKSADEVLKIRQKLYQSGYNDGYKHGQEDITKSLSIGGEQKQTWKPSEAQLIVIKELIEDKNTSKVHKVILRGMFDEFKQFINTRKREIDDAYLQGICDAKHAIEKQGKTLDPDKVIGWLLANICDYEYYVKRFKQDFGL